MIVRAWIDLQHLAISVFRLTRTAGVLALVASALSPWRVAEAQGVLRWTELDAAQIASLDRNRTAVFIPAGIVEAQGSMLPVGAELFRADRLAADLAATLHASRPDWTVVVLPSIPLGSGAFDARVGRAGSGGSLPVRASTVQAIFTDLGAALGAQGFQYLYVIDPHSDASHARALDLAGDTFSARHRGHMIHLLGRSGCHVDGLEPPPITLYSATAMTADADSPHAGTLQTARHWWLRPDLVDSTQVRHAPDLTAGAPEQRAMLARRRDWAGYVGAPRFATLELGQWLHETEVRNCSALASRFLDGLAEHSVPRYSDRMRADPALRAAMDASLRSDAGDATRRARRPARDRLPR